MATSFYSNFFKKAYDGSTAINFSSDTIKVALLTSSYTPDFDAHDYFDDVSAYEITGSGYTAGGATLSGKTITIDASTGKITFDATDPYWDGATWTNARFLVSYKSTGTASSSPLIALIDFGSDRSCDGGTFLATLNALGIGYITI